MPFEPAADEPEEVELRLAGLEEAEALVFEVGGVSGGVSSQCTSSKMARRRRSVCRNIRVMQVWRSGVKPGRR